jgi:hypothetical protein
MVADQIAGNNSGVCIKARRYNFRAQLHHAVSKPQDKTLGTLAARLYYPHSANRQEIMH